MGQKAAYNFLFFFLLFAMSSAKAADYLNEKAVLFSLKKAELAPIVDSTIKKFNFKVGESFKKGAVLALLDDSLYRQLYIKAKADTLKAEEAGKYTKDIYEYNKSLFKKGAIGEQELNESKLNMVSALSAREQAKANFKIAEIRLNSCVIKAPFAGRVISRLKNEHDYVREGQPIIEVADDNNVLAAINLPSELIQKVRIGMKLDFSIDELGTVYSGTAYSISGSINPGSRTFELKAIIKNDGKLRIGMSGLLITKI